ncbi:MAG: VTT domain-containing protein [Mariniphaga sp.]|jgi:membrane protein DedA with SNARE-associated domain|nr:VTT domain-containing protein [Mariniphaga sp.]
MGKGKVKLNKALYIVIASAVAIAIFSLTIGRELYEGRTQSLTSFGLVHFSGYLFFLLMPVEMAFVYYLSYYRETELIWVALVTAVTAQFIDYIIGLFFSLKSLTKLVGEKRILKAERYIQKYGNLTIFVFNFFPLSSPVIALAAGLLKYRFKDLVIFSVLGLFLKYLVLSLIF